MASKAEAPLQIALKGAFARAVNSRRFELALTQEEAALQLGVRQQTIHRWETGASAPQRRVWPALQEFLGLDREQLLELIEPGRTAEIVELRPGSAGAEPEGATEEERWAEALRKRLVEATVASFESKGEFNDLVTAAARYVKLIE